MLTADEVRDILDDTDDEDNIEGSGLAGFQPGSPSGKVHRELAKVKRQLAAVRKRERALKDRLAAAGIAV